MLKYQKLLLCLEVIFGIGPLIILGFIASYVLLGILFLIIFLGSYDVLSLRMIVIFLELFLFAPGLVGFFSLMIKILTGEVSNFSLNKIRIFLLMLILSIVILFFALITNTVFGDVKLWQIILLIFLPLTVIGHFILLEREYLLAHNS